MAWRNRSPRLLDTNILFTGIRKFWNAITSLTQGDTFYASDSTTVAKLAKDTNATRYLSNTGTSNNPAWAQVNLANGVTGNLPVTNLNDGSSAAATTVWHGDATWNQVDLSDEVQGDLPYANLTQATAASKLLGRGSAAGAGDWQEVSLGSGLSMSGTTLSSSAGSSTWDVDITKSANEDVTASTTLQDDDELTFAVGADENWFIELIAAYSGDATGTDMKLQCTFPTANGVYSQRSITSADAASSGAVRVSAATTITQLTLGTRSVITSYESVFLQLQLFFTAAGNFTVQHANNVSGVTRMAAGSILRAKQIV